MVNTDHTTRDPRGSSLRGNSASPVADRRRSSSASPRSSLSNRHRSPSAARRISRADPRRSSAERKYRTSVTRERPASQRWGKAVYFATIGVAILVVGGAGFGIGVAMYPNILNLASIQDGAGVSPIDVQSGDADDEVLINATSAPEPIRHVGVDSAECGVSPLPITAAYRIRRDVTYNQAGRLLSRKRRIVNGVEGSLVYLPWQASLWSEGSHACGGSIIASNWIVTAAHCLQPLNDPKKWIVHAGADLLEEMLDGVSQEMELSDFVLHPEYSTETYENDIALMRTKEHLVMEDMVSPVCLPTSDVETAVGNRCFISGWGAKAEGGVAEPALMNATVEIIDGTVCNGDEWLGGMVSTDIMICAGKESGEVDACQGDSGGPLSCRRDDGRFVVSGVVSWGIGCGTYRMPGVYARTSRFRSWILESIEAIEQKYR